MELIEKTVSSKYIFEGQVVRLRYDEVELPDGSFSTREIVEHNGGVAVAAITDNDEIILVRQYRHPYGEVILEIPAGKMEKGEDPFECGKRELSEETGFTAWAKLDVSTIELKPEGRDMCASSAAGIIPSR